MSRKPKQGFREAYAEQKAKMAAMQAAPDTPEAKRRTRLGGLFFIGLGLVIGIAMGVGFHVAGRVYVWLAAIPLAFLGVGLWALATGKLPKGRR